MPKNNLLALQKKKNYIFKLVVYKNYESKAEMLIFKVRFIVPKMYCRLESPIFLQGDMQK